MNKSPLVLLFAGVLILSGFGYFAWVTWIDVPSMESSGNSTNLSEQTESAATGALSNWQSFGGPRGNFVSNDTGWSVDWSGGFAKRWEAEIGVGYSCIAVKDQYAIAMGHGDGNETVFCFDVDTGNEKWRHTYPAKLGDDLHEGGPASTPTIYGDVVYSLSKDAQLHCLDLKTGKIVWYRDLLNNPETKIKDVSNPGWGFSSSPVVVMDKLLLNLGPLVALDPKDGETLWQTETFRPGYTTPVPFMFRTSPEQEEPMVCLLNDDKVALFELETGKRYAIYEWEGSSMSPKAASPIVSGNLIWVSGGYSQGCKLLAIDDQSLKEVYSKRGPANHMANSVLLDGYVYGIHGQSNTSRTCKLMCIDFRTGKVQWEERGFGCGSIIATSDRLLILSDSGKLTCAKATHEEFAELASLEVLDGCCWTAPSLANGKVFCRNSGGKMVCVELPKAIAGVK